MKKIFEMAGLALAALSAQAQTFVVSAYDNSSTGGTGLATISLTAGQSFTVTADVNDLWSAGALPRLSNANGLTGDIYANALDDSGQPVGTLIGQHAWGYYTQDGFTAQYGELVGQIGTSYYHIGTNFSGSAAQSGTLKLFYWDSNKDDNSGSISVQVAAVPEPESYALMLAGLGLMGSIVRRRKSKTA